MFCDLCVCSSEESSADDTCIVTELSDNDLAVLGRVSCVNFLCNEFLHREEERIALVAYTAADTENIGLEDVDRICYAGCKVLYVLVNYILSSLVSGSHSVK